MSIPWPRLSIGQQTDPGRDPSKQENEDALLYQELHAGHLLLVCDGMGGHSFGREASHLAVSTILNEMAKFQQGQDPGEVLAGAIREANRRVFAMAASTEHGHPGSTCVAVLIHPMGTEVAHLGDSRAYLLRAGQLWPLTRDHSMVREMVDAGLLRPEEAQGHPDSNKITRALGMGAEAQVELRSERLLQQPGDLFFLVSDGVTDVVRDSDLQAMGTVAIESSQIPQFCAQIVQLANARGGPDNITILAATVVDAGLRPEAAQLPPRRTAQPTVIETVEAALPELPSPRNQPAHTLPGIPEAPLPPAPPVNHENKPASSSGTGATVKLSTYQVENDTGRSTLTDLPGPSPSAGRRKVMGGLLLFLGLLLLGISWRVLMPKDEAPPPLLDPSKVTSSASAPG